MSLQNDAANVLKHHLPRDEGDGFSICALCDLGFVYSEDRDIDSVWPCAAVRLARLALPEFAEAHDDEGDIVFRLHSQATAQIMDDAVVQAMSDGADEITRLRFATAMVTERLAAGLGGAESGKVLALLLARALSPWVPPMMDDWPSIDHPS
jgi:hypothetical protein